MSRDRDNSAIDLALELSAAAAALVYVADHPDRWEDFTHFATATAEAHNPPLPTGTMGRVLSREIAMEAAARLVKAAAMFADLGRRVN